MELNRRLTKCTEEAITRNQAVSWLLDSAAAGAWHPLISGMTRERGPGVQALRGVAQAGNGGATAGRVDGAQQVTRLSARAQCVAYAVCDKAPIRCDWRVMPSCQ